MQKRVNREFVIRCWKQRDLHSHVVSVGIQIKNKLEKNIGSTRHTQTNRRSLFRTKEIYNNKENIRSRSKTITQIKRE